MTTKLKKHKQRLIKLFEEKGYPADKEFPWVNDHGLQEIIIFLNENPNTYIGIVIHEKSSNRS
jgi:hypothetical protein